MASPIAKHKKIVVFVGLAASAVFTFLALRRLDFAALRFALSHTNLFPWVPLGVLSYVAGHIVRGQRCRLLVRREAKLSLATASNIVVVGYASNNVFPARLGELVRAGMLAERTGIPVAQSLMVTFIERVLDGLAIILLLVLGSTQDGAPAWTHDLVRVALLVFGGASAVMLLGVFAPSLIVTASGRLGSKLGLKWHDRLVSLATSVMNAGSCLRDPRDAAKILGLSVVVWALEAGLFIAILPAFGLPLSASTGAVAMSVTNLGLLVPSSPGFIGPFHFFASRAVMAHGFGEPVALAYATVVHLAFYIPVTIWGALAMLRYGVEVGATAAIAREARAPGATTLVGGVRVLEIAALSPSRESEKASPFTLGLVEAICSIDGRPPHPEATQLAADFVHGQLVALPPALAVMFNAGMTFFRFVTRLRYLRGFCNLPLETRYRWTSFWAAGGVGLFRKLFKPVRATAFLAYYDHPAVRAPLVDGATVVSVRDIVRPRAVAATPVEGEGR